MTTRQNLVASLLECRGQETNKELIKRFLDKLLEFRFEEVNELAKALEEKDFLTALFYRITREHLPPETRLSIYQRIISKPIAIQLLVSSIQEINEEYKNACKEGGYHILMGADRDKVFDKLDEYIHLMGKMYIPMENLLEEFRNLLLVDKVQPCVAPFVIDCVTLGGSEIVWTTNTIFTSVIETETDSEKIWPTAAFWIKLIPDIGKSTLRRIYLDGPNPVAQENARRALILLGEYQLLSAAENIQENIMGDKYVVGQAGAVGPKSHAHDMSFTQIWQSTGQALDLQQLAEELTKLRTKLKETASEPEHDAFVGSVASAEVAAKVGNGPEVLQHLAKAGKWALEMAQQIGLTVATAALKKALGL